jgi:hypothetical protein
MNDYPKISVDPKCAECAVLPDSTAAAQQVWSYLFDDDPWPEGWQVGWMDDPKGFGCCIWQTKVIALNANLSLQRNEPILATLVHEFIHLRQPRLLHGKHFKRLVVANYALLLDDPECTTEVHLRQELAESRRELRRLRREQRQLQQLVEALETRIPITSDENIQEAHEP